MSRNGILVDYQYCTGCYSCEVACQAEHELPLEQWGVKVMQNGPWPIREADGTPTDRFVYDFIPSFTRICDLCAAARPRESFRAACSIARRSAWNSVPSTSS